MSISLTGRNAVAESFNPAAFLKDGVLAVSASSTPSDSRQLMQRFTNPGAPTGKTRANVQLLRKKVLADGTLGVIQADVTVSQSNAHGFTADDVDEIVTKALSFFDSEGTTGSFIAGAPRQ